MNLTDTAAPPDGTADRIQAIPRPAAADPLPGADLAVEATGLVKRFGEVAAVDGIDLTVRTGEVFGVLGPNGAGKTTMLRMLATLLPIDGGEARIFGVDVASKPHQIRQLVGVTGQYASVDENLTLSGLRLCCQPPAAPLATRDRRRTTPGSRRHGPICGAAPRGC